MTETANAPTLIGMDGKPIYDDAVPFPAMYIAHWPSGPVACCEDHARGIQKLGSFMGTHVAITNAGPGAQCGNCLNESKK